MVMLYLKMEKVLLSSFKSDQTKICILKLVFIAILASVLANFGDVLGNIYC